MKRRTVLRLLAVTVFLSTCAKSPKLPSIPPGKTVLAFGDSVTFGTGAATNEDWPTLLATLTGWNIVNAGNRLQVLDARAMRPLLGGP